MIGYGEFTNNVGFMALIIIALGAKGYSFLPAEDILCSER